MSGLPKGRWLLAAPLRVERWLLVAIEGVAEVAPCTGLFACRSSNMIGQNALMLTKARRPDEGTHACTTMKAACALRWRALVHAPGEMPVLTAIT